MLKGKTPLLVAVTLALLAGAVAWQAVKRKEKEVRSGWNLVPVVVANQEVAEGTALTYEMISQRPVPEQFVTSSVVKPDSASYVIGQKTLVPLQPGDLLLWSQFESARAAEKISGTVASQGRAFTLDVSGSRMSVGGWVRPNDHVDVIGTFRDPSSGEQFATTLMQNVIVLATGRITGTTNVNLVPDNQRDYSTITLLLLPEEAEMLSLAAELGSLSMMLRNPEDLALQPKRQHTTVATLLTGLRASQLEEVRKNTFGVDVWRGNHVTKEQVGTAPAPR